MFLKLGHTAVKSVCSHLALGKMCGNIEGYVLCALSMGALFLEEIKMKKTTDEQIANFIKQCADEIRDELDYKVKVAQSHMLRAENELLKSYSKEQLDLYGEFILARQNYYDALADRYKNIEK